MTLLRSILLAAVVGGALAGVLVTGLQALRLAPLILTAEHYERHGAAAGHAHAGKAGTDHGHDSRAPAAAGAEAAVDREEGWSPETPDQRTLATAFANLLTAIGFGLLLAAALALSGGADWHRGLLRGLGGYAVFVLAPSTGESAAGSAHPRPVRHGRIGSRPSVYRCSTKTPYP